METKQIKEIKVGDTIKCPSFNKETGKFSFSQSKVEEIFSHKDINGSNTLFINAGNMIHVVPHDYIELDVIDSILILGDGQTEILPMHFVATDRAGNIISSMPMLSWDDICKVYNK